MASPLEQVVQKWGIRARQATMAGIPPSAFLELGKRDIQSVMRGGSPMPDQEANLSIVSAALGKPVIKDPTSHTGFRSIPGNVASDVGSLVRGFIPGVVNLVHHAPSTLTDQLAGLGVLGKARMQKVVTKYGIQPDLQAAHRGDLLGIVRAASKQPIAKLVPGIHTAAALTTPQGRTELQQHPIGTALDILPLTAATGEVAASKLAEAGRTIEPGSALEALQQGRVVRAGIRAAVPSVVRARAAAVAEGMGIDAATREQLIRPYNLIHRKLQRDAASLWHNEVLPVVDGLSMEERAQLFHEATHYNPADTSISPAHHAIIQQTQKVVNALGSRGLASDELVKIPGADGRLHTYSADSDVARLFHSVGRAEERYASTVDKVVAKRDLVAEKEAKLSARQGKVEKFGERPEDFAARPEGKVGLDTVRTAIQPLVERFQFLDPLDAFPEFWSRLTELGKGPVASQFGRDIKTLAGEEGLFAKLDESLSSRDLKTASQTATTISRLLKHSGWGKFDTGQTLRSYMSKIRDELVGLGGRERTHGYAARTLQTAKRDLGIATTKATEASSGLQERQAAFMEEFRKSPPAAFHPLIAEKLRESAIRHAHAIFTGQQLDAAIRTITESPRFSDLKELLGQKEWQRIYDDSVNSWQDLARAGFTPVWMHHVDPSSYERILSPKPLSDRYLSVGQWKDKVFNFAPGMSDIAASITSAGVQLLAHEATNEFITKYVMPYTKTVGNLETEYRNALRDSQLTDAQSLTAKAAAAMKKEYKEFDPQRFGLRSTAPVTQGEQLMIPNHIARSLELMNNDFNWRLPVTGVYNKVMRTYKFAVLTGPRHIAHVGLGGMMFATVREPGTWLHLMEAIRQVKSHSADLELTQGLYNLNPDKIFSLAASKTMGRLFAESVGDKFNALARFEETIANVERVAVSLSAQARGLSKEEAFQTAYRTFIDMDGMSPIERTIIKQVFPFYAFTKHLFRYLFTLPVDYPIRTAILARLAEQHQEEWNSGLPGKFQLMFSLGQPDARGNVEEVEYRSLNPFRSIASDFSLAGFMMSLNPLLTAGMEASGLNILSATPELYPGLRYNAETGSLQATRSDVVPKLISAIIPETAAVDHFVQFTDSMKRLKQTSPDAYRRELYSSLNLPFATSKVNIPYELARTERNRYRAAQLAVSQGIRSGNWREASRFNAVPYQGQLVSPTNIQTIMEQIRGQLVAAGVPGVSPSAVLPRRSRKTIRR